MITKTAAKVFKLRTEAGQRPPIPEWCFHFLGEPATKINSEIETAIAFHYGNDAHVRRMVAMGLLDESFNTTEIGLEYLNARRSSIKSI